jgi:flagellar biosynthesis/type III secretory pathway protein FliH
MNTISILRLKGLTDADIMEIIAERQAKQLQEAYKKGYMAGYEHLLCIMEKVSEYVKQSDSELSC